MMNQRQKEIYELMQFDENTNGNTLCLRRKKLFFCLAIVVGFFATIVCILFFVGCFNDNGNTPSIAESNKYENTAKESNTTKNPSSKDTKTSEKSEPSQDTYNDISSPTNPEPYSSSYGSPSYVSPPSTSSSGQLPISPDPDPAPPVPDQPTPGGNPEPPMPTPTPVW